MEYSILQYSNANQFHQNYITGYSILIYKCNYLSELFVIRKMSQTDVVLFRGGSSLT